MFLVLGCSKEVPHETAEVRQPWFDLLHTDMFIEKQILPSLHYQVDNVGFLCCVGNSMFVLLCSSLIYSDHTHLRAQHLPNSSEDSWCSRSCSSTFVQEIILIILDQSIFKPSKII